MPALPAKPYPASRRTQRSPLPGGILAKHKPAAAVVALNSYITLGKKFTKSFLIPCRLCNPGPVICVLLEQIFLKYHSVCVSLLPFPSGQGTGCWGKKGGRGGWRRAGESPAHVKAEIKKTKIQTPRFSPPHPAPRSAPQVQAAKGQVQVRFRPRSSRLRLQSVREPPGGAPAILARARGSGGQSSRGGGRGANATQTCKKRKPIREADH